MRRDSPSLTDCEPVDVSAGGLERLVEPYGGVERESSRDPAAADALLATTPQLTRQLDGLMPRIAELVVPGRGRQVNVLLLDHHAARRLPPKAARFPALSRFSRPTPIDCATDRRMHELAGFEHRGDDVAAADAADRAAGLLPQRLMRSIRDGPLIFSSGVFFENVDP